MDNDSLHYEEEIIRIIPFFRVTWCQEIFIHRQVSLHTVNIILMTSSCFTVEDKKQSFKVIKTIIWTFFGIFWHNGWNLKAMVINVKNLLFNGGVSLKLVGIIDFIFCFSQFMPDYLKQNTYINTTIHLIQQFVY